MGLLDTLKGVFSKDEDDEEEESDIKSGMTEKQLQEYLERIKGGFSKDEKEDEVLQERDVKEELVREREKIDILDETVEVRQDFGGGQWYQPPIREEDTVEVAEGVAFRESETQRIKEMLAKKEKERVLEEKTQKDIDALQEEEAIEREQERQKTEAMRWTADRAEERRESERERAIEERERIRKAIDDRARGMVGGVRGVAGKIFGPPTEEEKARTIQKLADKERRKEEKVERERQREEDERLSPTELRHSFTDEYRKVASLIGRKAADRGDAIALASIREEARAYGIDEELLDDLISLREEVVRRKRHKQAGKVGEVVLDKGVEGLVGVVKGVAAVIRPPDRGYGYIEERLQRTDLEDRSQSRRKSGYWFA